MRRHRPLALVAGAVLAVALAGCGSAEPGQSDTPAAEDTTTQVTSEDPTTTSEDEMTTSEDDATSSDDDATSSDEDSTSSDDGGTATGASTELMTAESELGTILVDSEGMTLYLFTNDSPGMSTCEGDCLAAWPPLEGEPSAGEGADDSLLGSIERSDGTTQATYADWPLYYFAQDAEPGDVTGQGVNGVWYVISPDGEAITDVAPTEGSSNGFDY